MSIDCLYDAMLEVSLERQNYADVHSLVQRYDEATHQSTTVIYTAALLKVRQVCSMNNFGSDGSNLLITQKRLNEAERQAVEAVQAAVEYNPHVPLYLLEQKSIILPGEHILRRGDSDAIAYSFWHIRHWKRIPGSLTFLEYTWQSAFKNLPHHIDRGYKFVAYPAHNNETDREILPTQIHKLSNYPKRIDCPLLELPFFIILTFILFIITGVVAVLLHYYPEHTLKLMSSLLSVIKQPLDYLVQKWLALVNINFTIMNRILKID